jgi:hypothetical protein
MQAELDRMFKNWASKCLFPFVPKSMFEAEEKNAEDLRKNALS